MIELVTELEKLSNEAPNRKRIIKEAIDGFFHDFRSPTACGKMYFTQVTDWFCRHPVSSEKDKELMSRLSGEIKNGDYDEPCTMDDRKLIAQELNDSKCELKGKDKEFFAAGMGISKIKDKWGKTTYFVK